MNLSLKKVGGVGLSFLSENPKKVDLLGSTFVCADGASKAFDLDQWPMALFLKGLGAQSIEFVTQDPDQIEVWSKRISLYQQNYLDDPENFRTEECQWNQADLESKANLIVVQWPAKAQKRERFQRHITTPPLEASLGVDPDALLKFRQEIEVQSPHEIIFRIQSILKEFEKDSRKKDYPVLGGFLADTIAIALENKLMEIAVSLAETHSKALSHAWKDDEKLIRVLAAYDPKSSALLEWSRIFTTLPTIQLLRALDIHLSSPGGPQMVKLLNIRAQNESDELIEQCFKERGPLLKTLHQWLTPHWRPKHYDKIHQIVQRHFEHEDLLQVWIPTLLRSAPTRAFVDLVQYFEKPGIFKKRKPYGIIQKVVLDALLEHPTADAIQFVREIKGHLHGKLSYQAEKILSLQKATRF